MANEKNSEKNSLGDTVNIDINRKCDSCLRVLRRTLLSILIGLFFRFVDVVSAPKMSRKVATLLVSRSFLLSSAKVNVRLTVKKSDVDIGLYKCLITKLRGLIL